MKLSFTLFLRKIKPIVFVLVHLIALPRRFRVFMYLNTNLYWAKFGYKSAAGIDYFARDKDFGTQDWLLLPYYCFLKIATWIIMAAYWLALLLTPIFSIAFFWDSIFTIFLFIGWVGFLGELDKRLELSFIGEINWIKVYKEKKES